MIWVNAVGKFVYDQCSGWTKYLISYDSTTSTLNFKTEIYNYEKNMSITKVDYGYFYRGNVTDNYVDFAGMCFRIVRIQGDGSIKLILEDQDNTCSASDGNWNIPTTTGGNETNTDYGYISHDANSLTASDGTKNSKEINIMNYLFSENKYKTVSIANSFESFQTDKLSSYTSKLKIGDWCIGDAGYTNSNNNSNQLTKTEILDKKIKGTTVYYDSYIRLTGKNIKEPSLKCNGTYMTKYNDGIELKWE